MSNTPVTEPRQESEDTGMLALILQAFQTLMSGLHHFAVVIGLCFDGSIVFLSGGVPYWYYRLLHPKSFNDVELGDIARPQNSNNPILDELWGIKIRQVYNVWKTHRLIVGAILAPMFPLISISPLPKCSWAYIFAILCFVYGSITFTACVIHGVYFHNIDADNILPASWYTMPDGGFFRRDLLCFYVSLSLPTVWFAGFVASFAMTILMIMIGVHDLHDPLEIDSSALSTPCHNSFKFLLVVMPLILVIATISLIRGIKYAQENFQSNAR